MHGERREYHESQDDEGARNRHRIPTGVHPLHSDEQSGNPDQAGQQMTSGGTVFGYVGHLMGIGELDAI